MVESGGGFAPTYRWSWETMLTPGAIILQVDLAFCLVLKATRAFDIGMIDRSTLA